MAPISVTRRNLLTITGAAVTNLGAPTELNSPKTFPKLSRGINFHHVLNWPELSARSGVLSYVWPPFTDDKYRLRVQDLKLVVSLGFDFVRITVDPGIWMSVTERDANELERRYLNCIETLLTADLNVVFDLAAVDNHPDYSSRRLVSSENSLEFVTYSDIVRRAARLLSHFPGCRVALELFNEPPLAGGVGESCWAKMQWTLHSRARDASSDLPLILTAAQWGDGSALARMDPSAYRGSNVIYAFHYYEPHLFTHQGTKIVPYSYVSGLDWPITSEGARTAESAAYQSIALDIGLDSGAKARLSDQIERTFADQRTKPHNEATVVCDFDAVSAWAKSNSIDPQRVLLGEFGCVQFSRGRPVDVARLRWLTAVRSAAESHNFGWAYWAFKGYGGMELVDKNGALHLDLIAPLGLKPPR